MKTTALILILLTAALAGCSKGSKNSFTDEKNTTGIIGGEAAKKSDRVTASTVSLMLTFIGPSESFCTGTLISKNLVLTATHCLAEVEPAEIRVFFGETLPESLEDANIRKVKSVELHPDYKFELDPIEKIFTGVNDVALIMLETDAPEFAKPVAILNDTPLKVGQQILLAGFGLTDETTVPPVKATGLNLTRVTIAKLYANIIVTEQSNANGACVGDSGGPAYLETKNDLIVLGITRGPHNLAKDCRHWGEYTFASRFKDHILQAAEKMGAEAPVFVDAPTGL